MSTILAQIIEVKKREVRQAEERVPRRELEKIAATCDLRDFIGALESKSRDDLPAVIAEVKRASPTKGVLRQTFDPSSIAKSYENAGAACLSVLTDMTFFGGSASDLRAARAVSNIPVLRKDFIVDLYQVWEARAMGADCILLIAAILDRVAMQELERVARELGMAVLVEVRDATELDDALTLHTPLIGVNNRDLATFDTSITTTIGMRNLIPGDRILVTESGIRSRRAVENLRLHGVNHFLVGEALIRAEDPGEELRRMFF